MSKAETYTEAVGRRKTAIARVRLSPAAKQAVTVNGKDLAAYFSVAALRKAVLDPLALASEKTFKVSAQVRGGGIRAQAEAIRHGISRGIVAVDPAMRAALKREKFLMRDPRAKERRKFGLKKARKAAQWAKR